MSVSRPRPSAFVAGTTRRSSANAPPCAGAAQRNVAMRTVVRRWRRQLRLANQYARGETRDRGHARSPAATRRSSTNTPQHAGAAQTEGGNEGAGVSRTLSVRLSLARTPAAHDATRDAHARR